MVTSNNIYRKHKLEPGGAPTGNQEIFHHLRFLLICLLPNSLKAERRDEPLKSDFKC